MRFTKALYRKAFNQICRNLDFAGVMSWLFNLGEQFSGSNLSHIMPGDADGSKRRINNASFGNIVKANYCNLFRNLVAPQAQSLDGADCNQVIICEIAVSQDILEKQSLELLCP